MYTNRGINMLSFIITISLFVTIQYCINFFQNTLQNPNVAISEVSEVNNYINDTIDEETNVEEIVEEQEQTNIDFWKVEIPKINLVAAVNEGTTGDILFKSVGHFDQTPKFDGNVGLAGHNRGYNMNFFEKIKNLDVGDKIIYMYEGKSREYEVEKLVIIKETDWSYLETTNDNRVTLITCVKDSPEYRLCVQGKEIIESLD